MRRTGDLEPRSLAEITAEQPYSATLRNVVAVLDTKLALVGDYGVYEYSAGQAGYDACASAFRDLAAEECGQVDRLLGLLRSISTDSVVRLGGASKARFPKGRAVADERDPG